MSEKSEVVKIEKGLSGIASSYKKEKSESDF
jgi:hypothetical protein